MINFLLVKDKEIPVYLKYWYYKTKIEGLVFNKIYEATKVGTSLVLDNTIEHSMKIKLLSSDTTQDGTPTPDNPQEIHVVKGDNQIIVSNKNLFKASSSNHKQGLTINFNETTGAISFSGTTTGSYPTLSNYTNTNIPSGTYTFSIDKTLLYNLTIRCYNEQGAHPSNISIPAGNKSNTATINYDIKRLEIVYSISTSQVTVPETTIYPQFENGSTATDFVAHEEQNYPITLGDIELCKIGDYQDLIFKNTSDNEYYDSNLQENKWYKLGKIGKVVLDGSESWSLYNNRVYYAINVLNNIGQQQLLCNYFAFGTTTYNNNINYNTSNQHLNIYPSQEFLNTYSNVTDFKAWLSTHNTIVYYILSEPTKTLLSDTLQEELEDLENATSYNEVTNISQVNDDRPFILDVSYFRKVKYNE